MHQIIRSIAVMGLLLGQALPASADDGKAARKALRGLGVLVVRTELKLAVELEFEKQIGRVREFRKKLQRAKKNKKTLEKQIQSKKRFIDLAGQQIVAGTAEAKRFQRNARVYNTYVTRLNAMKSELSLERGRLENIEKDYESSDSKIAKAQNELVEYVLELRRSADRISALYEQKAADKDVQAAIDRYNATSKKPFKLAPSRKFQRALRDLKRIEKSVKPYLESDSIPLRKTSTDSLSVSVVLNETTTVDMLVDSGTKVIRLPRELADQCGVRIDENDPPITIELADGKKLAGRVTSIRSVQVGKFTAKDVKCIVLPLGAGKAEPLLGMSFLGKFLFQIDKKSSSLTLSDRRS